MGFADDIKILGRPGPDLTNDLLEIINWCKLYLMSLNITNCKAIHFGKNNPMIKYYLENQEIPFSRSIKDLGIIIETDMKFTMQIDTVLIKCYGITKSIFRHFQIKILNYCCVCIKIFNGPLLD